MFRLRGLGLPGKEDLCLPSFEPGELKNMTKTSFVELYPLVMQEEGEEWIVGREDISSYIAIPEIGVQTIRYFQEGLSIGEVQQRLEKEGEEEIDLIDFIESLAENELVKQIDDQHFVTQTPQRKDFLPWVHPHHVRWLFSRISLTFALTIIVAAILSLIIYPQLRPRFNDFFWIPPGTVLLAIAFSFGWGMSFFHEIFHLLAAKSRNIKGSLAISNRLHYLILETNVSDAWKLPRRQRYLLYLAGMLFEGFIMSCQILVLLFQESGWIQLPVILTSIMKMMVLITLLSLLWQLRFFMQTDLYYVIANFFNCKNLFADTTDYLAYLWQYYVKHQKEAQPPDIPNHELKAVKFYVVFFIIGTIFTLWPFFRYILPIAIKLIVASIQVLFTNPPLDSWTFWDAVFLLLFNFFFYSLLLLSLSKKHSKKVFRWSHKAL